MPKAMLPTAPALADGSAALSADGSAEALLPGSV
jgi:hypothetical protein